MLEDFENLNNAVKFKEFQKISAFLNRAVRTIAYEIEVFLSFSKACAVFSSTPSETEEILFTFPLGLWLTAVLLLPSIIQFGNVFQIQIPSEMQ